MPCLKKKKKPQFIHTTSSQYLIHAIKIYNGLNSKSMMYYVNIEQI